MEFKFKGPITGKELAGIFKTTTDQLRDKL